MSSYAPVRPVTTCHACGKTIDAQAVVCTGCGVMQPPAHALDTERKVLPVFLLAFLLGVFGAHRFFVGKTGTAVLQLFTLGGMGLWVLYDLVVIITGNFTDREGHKITEWV
jgi:predicted nucleic acid-binding Zn ribbon protein